MDCRCGIVSRTDLIRRTPRRSFICMDLPFRAATCSQRPTNSHRTIRRSSLTYPDFGESTEPDPDLGISDLADATIAFMDNMGIEKATLVGNSMGCITSIEASRKYPERVERLVLCSPAGGPYNQPLPKGLFQLARDGFHEPMSSGQLRSAITCILGLWMSSDYSGT